MKLNVKVSITNILHENKDHSIEALRGVALLLMVTGHVIGQNEHEGIRVSDDSIYRYIYYSLMYIRMPLFTAISGYVYSIRPVQRNNGNLLKFYTGKSRRLLIPLIFASTIHFLFQSFIPGVNAQTNIKELWIIYIYPFAHFWYLQALFIVFLFIGISDYFGLLNKLWKLLIFLALAITVHSLFEFTSFFSFSEAIYLLPFFILGCGIKRYELLFSKNKLFIISSSLFFVIGISLQQHAWFNDISYFNSRNNIIGMLVGLFGLVLLFKFRFNSSFFNVIGHFSYGVYLYHVFGTATGRIFLEIIHFDNNKFVVFVISLLLGLTLPIIYELSINKYSWPRLLSLGNKKKFGG